MARFRDKLKLIGEDLVIFGALAVAGTGAILLITFLSSIKINGATGHQAKLLEMLGYIHFGWMIAITSFIALDTLKNMVILCLGSGHHEK